MNHEVLYLEIDEEITAAIDKLLGLKGESVKIVVPKRSTLLQSIVNLKLLKRAAEDAGKEIVLVTGDRTSTHLAARVGLAVAATLKSQPAVPEVDPTVSQELVNDTVEAEEEPETVSGEEPAVPVKPSLAKPQPQKPMFAKSMMVRKPVGGEESAIAVSGVEDAAVKGHGSKVPNFNTLQKRIKLGAVALAGLILLFVLNMFLIKATVTLYAKGTKVNVNFGFTVDTAATESNKEEAILAGQEVKATQEIKATATATGKKDVGTKAKGEVNIKNCDDTSAHNFPAGSVVASQGKSFRTNEAVTIPAGAFGSGLTCISPAVEVGVTAAENGDSYNLAPSNYSSPSLNANYRITGTQMSGGTTKQVTVLTQADIDKARDEAMEKNKEAAQKDLDNKLAESKRSIKETFSQKVVEVKTEPAVDTETATASVTIKADYAQLTVLKDDFKDMVLAAEQKQVTDQNVIYDDGIDDGQITLVKNEGGKTNFNFTTDAYAGAKLDPAKIAGELKGKKYGDAADVASKMAGVERAEISLSPMWATKLPRIVKNIKIDIKVADIPQD